MGAIDADAHVIETVQTWSYLEGDERRFTPQLLRQTFGDEVLSNEGFAVRDFWVIEGRAFGKDRNVGTNTPQESREMLSVNARLAHMDELGIERRSFIRRSFSGRWYRKPSASAPCANPITAGWPIFGDRAMAVCAGWRSLRFASSRQRRLR